MAETDIEKFRTCTRFSEVRWHDSKLLGLYLERDSAKERYDLRLNLDLIVSSSQGAQERQEKTALFKHCRILRTDLDLLGVLICSGDIASGLCYPNALEVEGLAHRLHDFDFPQTHNPVEECLGFVIEMINPGGEILIVAKDFELT